MRRLSCVQIISALKLEVNLNTVPTSQNNPAPPLLRPTFHDVMKINVKVNAKLFLCTLCWYMGDMRCSSTHSQLQHYVEVSGQLHAPSALSLGRGS